MGSWWRCERQEKAFWNPVLSRDTTYRAYIIHPCLDRYFVAHDLAPRVSKTGAHVACDCLCGERRTLFADAEKTSEMDEADEFVVVMSPSLYVHEHRKEIVVEAGYAKASNKRVTVICYGLRMNLVERWFPFLPHGSAVEFADANKHLESMAERVRRFEEKQR